jgi:hypothetical protein
VAAVIPAMRMRLIPNSRARPYRFSNQSGGAGCILSSRAAMRALAQGIISFPTPAPRRAIGLATEMPLQVTREALRLGRFTEATVVQARLPSRAQRTKIPNQLVFGPPKDLMTPGHAVGVAREMISHTTFGNRQDSGADLAHRIKAQKRTDTRGRACAESSAA